MRITSDLLNNWVKIKSLNFIDETSNKKFESLGIFKNQIVYLKKLGNLKQIIGIEVNQILYGFRLEDLKYVDVEMVKKNETR